MVRIVALSLILAGCAQPDQAEQSERQKREAEKVYGEIVAQIIAERSPTPTPSPTAWPKPERSIDEIRSRAEQSTQRARDSQEFYEQQERQRLEARVRNLEDAQINGAD